MPKRRSSPGWSRRRGAYSPTADVEAAVGRANVVLDQMRRSTARSAPTRRAAVDVSAVKIKPEEGGRTRRATSPIGCCRSSTCCCPTTTKSRSRSGPRSTRRCSARLSAAVKSQRAAAGRRARWSAWTATGRCSRWSAAPTTCSRATTAPPKPTRQPGSAWKLFVYLRVARSGLRRRNDRVVDTPVTINGWSPRNSSGRFVGETNLRTAFAYSINTVAAQLGNEVGFGTVAGMARRFGITTPIATTPSMVLGSSDVRVIDLMRAFAAVARRRQSRSSRTASPKRGHFGRWRGALPSTRTARSYQLVPDYVAAGHDRPAADRGQHRHRARRADRPAGRGQDRYHHLEQGRLVRRLLERGDHRRLDGPRRCPRGAAGCRAATAPARAFAAYMRFAVREPPGRGVPRPTCSCPNGRKSPTTSGCTAPGRRLLLRRRSTAT